MKQFICLLTLLIGVLNTHGTPIHIGIGAGESVAGLENVPAVIGSGSELIVGGSSEASVPAEASESSSAAPASSEPSVPAEASESSSAAPASSEPSVPAEASESSSAAAESTAVPAATTENPATPVPSTESPRPVETSTSPAPSNSSTESSATSGSTIEVTPGESESEEATESEATNEESESSSRCLGRCPARDSFVSVYLVNERCDKFCQCSNGRAIVLSCPGGLHFNRVLNVCDWPINAKCTKVAILN